MISSDLEAEWHPTLNLPLLFNASLPTSKKYWWLGKCSHEWQGALSKRQQGINCPYCENKQVLAGFNDLATTHPLVTSEWHPTRNGELTAEMVKAGSHKKVWWLGLSCTHEYFMGISERTRHGSSCHYCSGHRVLEGFNDFASNNPLLLLQWHPIKNTYSPYEVSKRTRKKAWWLGECGHEWESTILSRAAGAGCPFCSGNRILEGFNDLLTLEPIIAAEWHPTLNKDLDLVDFGRGSRVKVWWLGKDCNHEWKSSIGDRVFKKTGCHLCSGYVIDWGQNDLLTLHPHLRDEIHPTKNTPDLDISKERLHSSKKLWWLGACGHEFESPICSRTNNITAGSGCPYCGGNKVLEGFNDLASQNPQLASEFHPTLNGQLLTSVINAKSGKKFWWLGKCGHEWQAHLSNRDNGAGCSVCAGKTVLAGFNDLASKLPILVPEWHPMKNGTIQPNQITVSSNKKFWWMCSEGHEWESRPNTRAKGSGCPTCSNGMQVSKVEKLLHDFVATLGVQFETSNRIVLRGKELDLYIPIHKIGIEFNGTYWHQEKQRGKTLHYDKWVLSNQAGIQLLQIWEDDWRLKSDVVKQALVSRFAPDSCRVASVVVELSGQQASSFLDENHLLGATMSDHYFGLTVDGDIDSLQAVLAVNSEAVTNSLELVRFASSEGFVPDFKVLLDHVVSMFAPASIFVTADNCLLEAEVLESNGFKIFDSITPDYMYVIRNERVSRSDYPVERFQSDSKLLWEARLAEMELADLNGLARIWDAGKTMYRLDLSLVRDGFVGT